MQNFGHISLNGHDYRVDLQSYQQRDLADFAPRAPTPASAVYSELLLYQPLTQEDWRHGFGFPWFQDASGYRRTHGSLDTRWPGVISLSPAALQWGASLNPTQGTRPIKGFVAWNGQNYFYGTAGLFKVISMSVSDPTILTLSTTAVWSVLPTKDYLFVSENGTRIRALKTDDTFETDPAKIPGVNDNAKDYAWMVIHQGFIYCGKANTNEVYYSADPTLHDLAGLAADDPNMIRVGAGGFATLKAISYAGKLYIARQDGLWELGTDRICRNVVDFHAEADSNNFAGLAVFNGQLTFSLNKHKIFQWNGVRMTDITPGKIEDGFPVGFYGYFSNFLVINNMLYLGAVSYHEEQSPYGYLDHEARSVILCFDGVGWHAPWQAGSSYLMSDYYRCALGYDPVSDYMLTYHMGPWSGFSKIKFGDNSFYPTGPFPTMGATNGLPDNSLVTSRFDMGYRRVTKSSPSILLQVSHMRNDDYTGHVTLHYALDDGPWVKWIEVDEDGVYEFNYPNDAQSIEYKWITFRIGLISDNASWSPLVEGFTLRFLLRPDVFYGWNLNIVAAPGYIFGMNEDSRTVSEIIQELQEARDSKVPIKFTDLEGNPYFVYVSSYSRKAIEMNVDAMGETVSVESLINVNIVEAK